MKNIKERPLMAIQAYKALKKLGGIATVTEIYEEMQKKDMYQFNTPSKSKDKGVLGQSIKRHMFDSRRSDKNFCILFHSIDGLHNKNSKVQLIRSAPKYIIKLGRELEKYL